MSKDNMKTVFNRLVRFKDPSGNISFGEASSESIKAGDKLTLYQGEEPWSLVPTDQVGQVSEVCSMIPESLQNSRVMLNMCRSFALWLRRQSYMELVLITGPMSSKQGSHYPKTPRYLRSHQVRTPCPIRSETGEQLKL